MLYSRLWLTASVLLFIFIGWIISQADAGNPNIFSSVVQRIPAGDKLGHFWLYGLLALMLSFAWREHPKRYFGLPLGCALVLFFALAEEFSQGFFPLRTLDLTDAAADYLGVQLACWFVGRASQ